MISDGRIYAEMSRKNVPDEVIEEIIEEARRKIEQEKKK